MDLGKPILGGLIERQTCSIDHIVEEAFREHFGFDIHDVQDKDELEHIIVQGDPIESLRYRGETFLYLKRDSDIKFESNKDGVNITLTTQFMKV